MIPPLPSPLSLLLLENINVNVVIACEESWREWMGLFAQLVKEFNETTSKGKEVPHQRGAIALTN